VKVVRAFVDQRDEAATLTAFRFIRQLTVEDPTTAPLAELYNRFNVTYC
jgi:hypothetical protein